MSTVLGLSVKDAWSKVKAGVVVSGLAASVVVADQKVDSYNPISFGDKRPQATQLAQTSSTQPASITIQSDDNDLNKIESELRKLIKEPSAEQKAAKLYPLEMLLKQNENYDKRLEALGTVKMTSAEGAKFAKGKLLIKADGSKIAVPHGQGGIEDTTGNLVEKRRGFGEQYEGTYDATANYMAMFLDTCKEGIAVIEKKAGDTPTDVPLSRRLLVYKAITSIGQKLTGTVQKKDPETAKHEYALLKPYLQGLGYEFDMKAQIARMNDSTQTLIKTSLWHMQFLANSCEAIEFAIEHEDSMQKAREEHYKQ